MKNTEEVSVPGFKITAKGFCPKCKISWDGGDILEELGKLERLKHLNENEIKTMAEELGWTKDNEKRFTKLVFFQLPINHPQYFDEIDYYLCPGCRATFEQKRKS